MSSAALLPWLLLLYLFAEKKKPKPQVVYHHPPVPVLPPIMPAPPIVTIMHPAPVVAPAPPAWPAVLPPGLPPFPGPGWVPDSPPPAPVIARAVSLLPQLWAQGQGTHVTEQTAGRWITYLATMIGTKKSVVAYRLAASVPVSTMPPVSPAPIPTVYHPAPAGAPPVAAVPVATPAGPVHIPASPAPANALPTLRLTHPNTKGPSVVYLQQKLGIAADGVFGSGTDRAVRAFQTSHGLTPDGIVGRKTWAALG